VGCAIGFRRSLVRKTLAKPTAVYRGASGPHKGIETANVPWEIYAACSNGETIDAHTYVLLHSVIDLDGLYDLIEMAHVHQTWATAAAANATEAAQQKSHAQSR